MCSQVEILCPRLSHHTKVSIHRLLRSKMEGVFVIFLVITSSAPWYSFCYGVQTIRRLKTWILHNPPRTLPLTCAYVPVRLLDQPTPASAFVEPFPLLPRDRRPPSKRLGSRSMTPVAAVSLALSHSADEHPEGLHASVYEQPAQKLPSSVAVLETRAG